MNSATTGDYLLLLLFCLTRILNKINLPRRLVEMYYEDYCFEIVIEKLWKYTRQWHCCREILLPELWLSEIKNVLHSCRKMAAQSRNFLSFLPLKVSFGKPFDILTSNPFLPYVMNLWRSEVFVCVCERVQWLGKSIADRGLRNWIRIDEDKSKSTWT